MAVQLLLILVISTSGALAVKPHTTCARTYTKLGCYVASSGPLSQLLITDRDTRSPLNDGHKFKWEEFEASLHSLACRCAKLAKDKQFKVFGLQNFGECWSGPGAENEYARDGKSSKCYQILSIPAPPCNKGDAQECVGAASVSYVYRLKPQDRCAPNPCKNGGTCAQTSNGFACKCSVGYLGMLCEKVCTQAHSIDLGIMLDGSGSIGNINFINTKLFLLKLVDQFRVGPADTHFGLIVYSDEPHLCFSFNKATYHNSIGLKFRILGENSLDGKARTDKALALAGRTLFRPQGGDRPDFPNVLVVFTDGNTVHGSESYEKVLKPLRDRGVKTIAVGVGGRANDTELLKIAMGKRQNVVHADRADNLPVQLTKIIRDIC